MKFLRVLFLFYINSNIHVAVAMFSFVKITLLPFGIYENTTPLFVFFATIVSYNFIRIYKLNDIDMYSSIWIHENKRKLIVLNLISIIFLICLSFSIRFNAILILTPFILTTFFYIVPFVGNKRSLRSIAGLKLFLIAVTGAGVTVLFPLVHNGIDLQHNVWVIFIQRILFIIAYTIPFDIRDKDDDHIHLKTLPQLYGANWSKVLGSIALAGFLILELIKHPFDQNSMMITAIVSVIAFISLLFTKVDQNRNYTAFWIEAIPVVWFILMVLY